MMHPRYIFATIYIISSCFVAYPSSLAVEAESTMVDSERLVAQSSSRESLEPSDLENVDPEVEIMDRHWSFVAMFATSALFLLILVSLFKKDENHREEEFTESLVEDKNLTILKDENLLTLLDDVAPKTNAIEATKSVDNHSSNFIENDDLIKTEELVDEPTFPMIGMYEEEVSPSDQTIQNDRLNSLSVVTSDNTEIDDVFELIQDLRSHPSGDIAAKNVLRRKAIWELGQTKDFRAIEPLIRTIPEVNSLEKSLILNAVTQIANSSFETIENVLLISLKDEDARVRKNAIQDLTTLYHSMSTIIVRLSAMVEDSDLEVQQTAKQALKQFTQMSRAAASVESANHVDKDLVSDNGKLRHY